MTPVMLASDGGIFDPLLPALGGGAVIYLTSVISAKLISDRPWLWGFLLAALWGVLFPVVEVVRVAVVVAYAPTPITLWAQILPESVVTAGLLAWASRSLLPPVGVIIGYVLTVVLARVTAPDLFEYWSGLLVSLPWHAGTAAGLFVWALREHRKPRHGVIRCPSCGYDLSGLRTRTCPECGGKGRPSAPALFRDAAPGGETNRFERGGHGGRR